MNIVIPIAGLGSRFVSAGYSIPKPFIPVKGKPMIEHVIDNVATPDDKIYIICLAEHMHYFSTTNLNHRGNISIIPQMGRLQGAAKSVLLSEKFIDTDEPLIIANSDQWVRYDLEAFRKTIDETDGCILTLYADHPKYSFAQINDEGYVTKVAEKIVISNEATVGIYGFKRGSDFVKAAHDMIDKDIRTNDEFYVCPIFNELLDKKIKVLRVEAMFGMGSPEDLEANYNNVGI